MSAERHDYQQYEGLPKEERRKRITDTKLESLETRRFLLSKNPELKERMKILQKAVDDFKKQYPEIISLNLFGSLVKGYANNKSDVDAYLFVDTTKEPKDRKPGTVYNRFVKAFQQSTGMEDEQVKNIFLELISPDIIIRWITRDPFIAELETADLFRLAIGRDINNYRKIVFDTLESMGQNGEQRWQKIMEALWDSENRGLPDELREKRKKLYPQTIAEGRRVFLQES